MAPMTVALIAVPIENILFSASRRFMEIGGMLGFSSDVSGIWCFVTGGKYCMFFVVCLVLA